MNKTSDIILVANEHETVNIYSRCSEYDVSYFFVTLASDILGIYQNVSGKRIIFINKQLEDKDRSFVCYLQLKHALLNDFNKVLFRSAILAS